MNGDELVVTLRATGEEVFRENEAYLEAVGLQ